jgi:hypothetical protein
MYTSSTHLEPLFSSTANLVCTSSTGVDSSTAVAKTTCKLYAIQTPELRWKDERR